MKAFSIRSGIFLGILLIAACNNQPPAERKESVRSLPSWNEGATKQSIVDFVDRVTNRNDPAFVLPAERIAVFDNDGTLWSEQPMYVPLVFVVDRIQQIASLHPDWKKKQPYRSILQNGVAGISAIGEQGITALIETAMGGLTTEESDALVKSWMTKARHPELNRPYTELIYQPMVELLQYLRSNGFKTYIVSGGGVDFMRPWMEQAYGIPPEQVIGSLMDMKYEESPVTHQPSLSFFPKMGFYSNGPNKPVAIRQFIGRRPVFAAGNSDGDRQMLEYTATGEDKSHFAMIVHHTDAQREVAYDRQSRIGKLDQALNQASKAGWTVVNMKQDWKTIFPAQTSGSN